MAAFGTSLMDRVNIFFKVRRYIKMVAERWVVLMVCVVVGGAISIYRALQVRDVYLATSEIGIAPKIQIREDITKPIVVEELNSFYDRQLAAIRSQAVEKSVMKDLAERKMAPPAVPFHSADRQKGNNNILLSVTDGNLDLARAYAAAWAEEFLNYREQSKRGLIDKSASQTREEVARYENLLKEAHANLWDFQKTNNIYNAKEVVESLMRSIEAKEARLAELQGQIKTLKGMDRVELANAMGSELRARSEAPAKGEKLAAGAEGDPLARFEGSSSYPKLNQEVQIKMAEKDRLSRTLKDKHPYMVKLSQEIDDLNQLIKLELDSLEQKRKAKIKSLEIEADPLPGIIKGFKDQLFNSRQLLLNYSTLTEKVEEIKLQLNTLEKRLETLSAPPEEEGTFTILTAGESSGLPFNANRTKTVVMGFLASIAVGLGLIYGLGRLDDRVELAEDIETELGEPVLGQIPLVDKKSTKLESLLLTRMPEHSMFAEAIRGVRSAVMLGMQGGPKQVLLVTSAVPGDGKTTFTVNFAVTLAIAGNRVLLVDADLRRGNIHAYFDQPRDPGYAEVLQGEVHWRDAVQKTEVRTLEIIGTGKLPPNPGELLMSPINRQFVYEIRQSYDYVVFDCPPLTAIDDTFSLVSFSDGMLFVVRSGQTSMRFAANALDAVRKRGAQVMGLILNGITADNPYYYYKNYYHEYYNKGLSKTAGSPDLSVTSTRMAAQKQKSGNLVVSSIDDAAKARSGREHLVGSEASENTKASQFRAIRAAKKVQSTPSGTEDQPQKEV